MDYQFVKMHNQMVIKMLHYFVRCDVMNTQEATADWKPAHVLETRKHTPEMLSMFDQLASVQGVNTITEEEYFTAAYSETPIEVSAVDTVIGSVEVYLDTPQPVLGCEPEPSQWIAVLLGPRGREYHGLHQATGKTKAEAIENLIQLRTATMTDHDKAVA